MRLYLIRCRKCGATYIYPISRCRECGSINVGP